MLVVIENTQGFFWHAGDPVVPLNHHGEVVVVFDPSKTNMAMIVATPKGEHLAHIEFSGNNRKAGPIDDNTVYCYEVRQYLKVFLHGCKVYMVATEQAITKKSNRKGMAFNHYTNMTLTEIRANILSFFLEEFGIRVLEINNWSWKHAILPEGYRSPFEKGSKKFFLQHYPSHPLSMFYEADMTDCACILQYVVNQFCNNYTIYCSAPEEKLTDYKYTLVRADFDLPNVASVLYNPNYSLETNMNYYANRILGVFTMLIDFDCLQLEDIYGHSLNGNFNCLDNDKVKAVVNRI